MNPESIHITSTPGRGKAILAKRKICKGETIYVFPGKMVSGDDASPLSLQLDDDTYLELNSDFAKFINHSCSPNCHIEYPTLKLITLADIKEGEELNYDYNTNDYDLTDGGCDFTCSCGAHNCVGDIKGFKFLDTTQRLNREKFLAPYLKKKL
jgi:hypothetical protein